MATVVPYVAERENIAALTHARVGRMLTAYGIVRPRRLRWVGPWLPRLTFGWQGLKREMRPFRVRWGWVLLLALVLFFAVGECGPVVSTIATLP